MSNTNLDIWIAGAFAAFSVDLLVYPLDTIKTRLQSPDYSRLYLHAQTQALNKPLFFRGLYQGLFSVILATVPSSGAFFTTYEAVKSGLHSQNARLFNGAVPIPILHSLASGTAELVSCFILTPAEVLKQNAQMVDRKLDRYPMVKVLARFRKQPTELWRGYSALALRNLPYTAMQFPMFEYIKSVIRARREEAGTLTRTTLEAGVITSISAGSAGSVAAVITTPIDVVKTRIMLSAGKDDRATSEFGKVAADLMQKKRPSPWAVGKQVLQKEGIRGLFRGGALRGAWTALGSGLYLGVYDSGRTYLEKGRIARNKNDDA